MHDPVILPGGLMFDTSWHHACAYVPVRLPAHLTIKKPEDLAAVERILFDNLLLAIYLRTEHLNGTIFFSGT